MKLNIRVKTCSGKQKIINKGNEYIVYLKARAEQGKANMELLKLLKKYFKEEVRIIKGFKSKDKVIEVIE